MLKLPLFGPLILKSAMANLSLVMANLLKAGVPVVRVLEICTQASNNVVIPFFFLANLHKSASLNKILSLLEENSVIVCLKMKYKIVVRIILTYVIIN